MAARRMPLARVAAGAQAQRILISLVRFPGIGLLLYSERSCAFELNPWTITPFA